MVKTMNLKYEAIAILFHSLLISIVFFSLGACCREDSKQVLSQKQVIVDSPSERRIQAQKLIEKYPMPEWKDDIIEHISLIAGKTVSLEVKNRAAAKLSDQEVLEKRIALLTSIYNASELARLSELYSNETDNKLIKKLSDYDNKLRELVSPLVIEVLSNSQ